MRLYANVAKEKYLSVLKNAKIFYFPKSLDYKRFSKEDNEKILKVLKDLSELVLRQDLGFLYRYWQTFESSIPPSYPVSFNYKESGREGLMQNLKYFYFRKETPIGFSWFLWKLSKMTKCTNPRGLVRLRSKIGFEKMFSALCKNRGFFPNVELYLNRYPLLPTLVRYQIDQILRDLIIFLSTQKGRDFLLEYKRKEKDLRFYNPVKHFEFDYNKIGKKKIENNLNYFYYHKEIPISFSWFLYQLYLLRMK